MSEELYASLLKSKRGFSEEKARMGSEISSVICTEVYAGLYGRRRVYTQDQWKESAYED